MTADTTVEIKRRRFWELRAQRDRIHAESKPVRERYEQKVREIDRLRAEAQPIIDQFKEIEQPLVGIDQELSHLARALGGKTGQPPAEA